MRPDPIAAELLQAVRRLAEASERAALLLDTRVAPALERIFRAKGIRREALGSLRLFCDAARREAATLELVRKARTDVERAGRG